MLPAPMLSLNFGQPRGELLVERVFGQKHIVLGRDANMRGTLRDQPIGKRRGLVFRAVQSETAIGGKKRERAENAASASAKEESAKRGSTAKTSRVARASSSAAKPLKLALLHRARLHHHEEDRNQKQHVDRRGDHAADD